jgi:hypothetical protein
MHVSLRRPGGSLPDPTACDARRNNSTNLATLSRAPRLAAWRLCNCPNRQLAATGTQHFEPLHHPATASERMRSVRSRTQRAAPRLRACQKFYPQMTQINLMTPEPKPLNLCKSAQSVDHSCLFVFIRVNSWLPGFVRFLQRRDVDLVHLHHRVHDTLGFRRIGIGQHVAENDRADLPRESEFVF